MTPLLTRDLKRLADETFDLVVVGGGMFGAAAALDAAQRGLRVALVERGDFGGATSAHSFKMLHGGIRYLQHADIVRVRQSAAARAAYLRAAPHLARPLPIVVPTYGHGMKGKPVLKAGMALYDALTLDRNRGIADPTRRIPAGYTLNRAETLHRYPGLDPKGLTGAGVFADGQMYNPTRLVLAYVRSAAEQGAVVANYLEATGFTVTNGRVRAVKVEDRLGTATFEVRTKAVLNAAGPYAQRLLGAGLGLTLDPPTPFSRDAYFVVARPVILGDAALTIPARTPRRRSQALARRTAPVPRALARRHARRRLAQGVRGPPPTRTPSPSASCGVGSPRSTRATPASTFVSTTWRWARAGLVPFGEGAVAPADEDGEQELKFAHRSRLIDHGKEHGIAGLITLIGVRYTTAPIEATPAR